VFAGCAGDYYVGGPYESPCYGDFGPYCSGYGASVRRRFGDRRISLPKPFRGAIFMDEALALEMLVLPTDQEDFMAVGSNSNGDQSRAFDLDG
jgi:hypothetical protein